MARECGTDKHNVWNKWPEHVQQTDRTCERNDYCKHADQMTPPEYLLQHEHFYKVQAAQERDMITDVSSPKIGFFCIVLFEVCIYREDSKKTYTYFKKGKKNCIKIVILNSHRWLFCLSHGDASIHLTNAIFWANVLLQLWKVIHR